MKTPSGYRNIEDIRAGDKVLSYNEHTKRLEVQTVAQTFIRKTDRIYTLVYDTGTKLQTTATHPFYIEGKGWVKAADLHIGDDSLLSREVSQLDVYGGARLQNVSYRQSKQGVIVGITVEDRAETVYNFEVNETHTYLVGESDVVVHNSPPEYREMPTIVVRGERMPAEASMVQAGGGKWHIGERLSNLFNGDCFMCTSGQEALTDLINHSNSEVYIRLPDGSSVERVGGREQIVLRGSDGKVIMKLSGNADLQHLIENSGGTSQINETKGTMNLVENAVSTYYSRFKGQGGQAEARNEYDSGSFNYARINQVLTDYDAIDTIAEAHLRYGDSFREHLPLDLQDRAIINSKGEADLRGLECAASSTVHYLKSLGIIRPDMSRAEVERAYTNMHSNPGKDPNLDRPNTISSEFDSNLRFKKPGVNKETAAAWANTLRDNDWAKLTGASNYNYTGVSVPRSEVLQTIQNGELLRMTKDAGTAATHFVAGKGSSDGFITYDDSLFAKESDPTKLTKKFSDFWKIERTRRK
ncbi:MAG: hypothetical protein F9K24_09440 [Leptonema illini]|uniref:Intein C-terminal splicing domain-containing protein n=1 Tax=Leptonema illini TaxID=183 RepID=A0A833LYF6_9LEPT|nr:MAG: hypothetical protein F9K24_09440 [Leptonema illini]